jgi:CBS domain-containing protein
MAIDGARWRGKTAVENAPDRTEGNVIVRDVMSTDVPITGLDDTVRDAARLMSGTGAKLLPVCDGARLVGVLTDWDVISAVADGGAPDGEFVRNYMSVNVVAVTPDTGMDEARELIAHRHVHHIVVCDREGRLAGIVHVDIEWSQLAAQATYPTLVPRLRR